MPSIEPITLGRFRGFVASGGGYFPPLLAVHGAFGQPSQLAPLQTALAQRGITSYALALSGHVEATPDAVRGLGVYDYVRDVQEMIEHLPALPVLLGHSMGGLICEKVAEMGAMRGLVLAAAAPAAPLMARLKALPTWLTLLPGIARGVPLAPPRAEIAALAFTGSNSVTRQAVVEALVPESGRAMRDMLLGAVRVDRGRIRCPVMALFGDTDYLVPPWQMRAEARRLGATVIEYEGAGHFLVEDAWRDHIADDIAAWIRRVVGAKSSAPIAARA